MPRGSWRNLPEWQHTEDNPDPAMRPSVDHLTFQLKKHKALKNRPDAVVFVIKRLTHWFLVHQDQRPDILWDIIYNTMSQFRGLMPPGKRGFEDWTEEQMDQEFDRIHPGWRQLVAVGVGTGGNTDSALWPKATIGVTPADPGGDRPEVVTAGRVVIFEDTFLRQGVEDVILRHRGFEYVQGRVKCRCQRFYDTPEAWAKHLRIRIWRFLKNEFPPIPSGDSEELVEGGAETTSHPDSNRSE